MRRSINPATNEQGYALMVSLLILVVLSFLGLSSTNTTSLELQIAGGDKKHHVAFYTAEAGKSYVVERTDLYHGDNITVGGSLDYPNTADSSELYSLALQQTFNGNVEYSGASAPPRGSGYEVGKFRAHRYQISSNGNGPGSARSRIQAGFYRIGF